ncbi:MBL fold metallo-hydrolase RNA specificity domain-containing protein [Thermococcus sp. P6]|uniref:MBL fold metallo-hydrolase RNA specificity domain-containing protein n=1 Tax=Thermococcus sp. P6 TaxID=122420 RepID=UPI001E36BBEA|nr:MBL fold metallo-hydrolase RNA specificity domain-containing protein [Thermococcus sp. P6]
MMVPIPSEERKSTCRKGKTASFWTFPIVGSPATLAILKAINDTSRGGNHFGIELPYYRLRVPQDEGGFVLESRRGDYPSRPIVLTEENESLREFLFYRPGQESGRVRKIVPSEVETLEGVDLAFEIHPFPVDHSIYGALAYVIEGDVSLAYTGDFRLHGKKGKETEAFIRAARNSSVLITEGTRVGREEHGNVSEEEVYENALRIVEESRGLVVADFSARNFERLESFKRIAEKSGRELVITAKDAYFLHALRLVDGVERLKGLRIYGDLKAKRDKWETVIVQGNYSDQYVSPAEIRSNPQNYLLCFSFYDMPNLLDVMPEGGDYIYSSSEAFGEEQEFSFLRLWNWLRYFGFEVHGFRVDRYGRPRFEKGLHASGHLSREELREVIEGIDPDFIVPVHTEKREWFRENWGERVLLPKNGEGVEF